MTTHHVASLDFDDCLSIAASLLKNEMEKYGIKHIYPGTARQSKHIEYRCMGRGFGHAYTVYQRFAENNNLTFSPRLIEDVLSSLKAGETIKEVTTKCIAPLEID